MTRASTKSLPFSIVTPCTPCNCGGEWERVTSPNYSFSYPICKKCKMQPSAYIFKRVIDGHVQKFLYTSKGARIRSLADVQKTALEVNHDILCKSFSKKKYKRNLKAVNISDTFGDFIQNIIFPRWYKLEMTFEDKVWIEDYMQPFMGDIGIFVVSKIHLMQFLKVFNFDEEERERAKRLFEVITNEISI